MNWKKAYSLQDALENPEQTTELYIHQRPMAVFPMAIFQLTNLRKLEITACRLKNLPDNIGDLNQLEVLVLTDNQMSELPKSINQLKNLQEIDLGNNAFAKFPREVLNIKKLERLKLSDNKIKTIPKTIYRLRQLKKLDISKNLLRELPTAMLEVEYLENLNAEKNRLSGLPDGLGRLTQLKRLFLSDNKITAVPESIGRCTSLIILELSRNKLTRLPAAVTNCEALVRLSLSKNELTALPTDIGALKYLQELDLSNNKLNLLPPSVQHWQNLHQLLLSKNELASLPRNIVELKELKILNLASNRLSDLPEGLEQLKKLRDLNLTKNPIEKLPETLMYLPWLDQLQLPTALKDHRGLPAFFKRCIKAALPEKNYLLFYQLTMGDQSVALTDEQLLFALRFPDTKIQDWAREQFLQKHSLPLSQNPLKAGAEIILLGRTNFKKSGLKEDLKKQGIGYVHKVTNSTTHAVLGTSPFIEKSMLASSLVYITEEILSDFLRQNSEQILLKSKTENLTTVATLLTSNIEGNIRLALELLKAGGVPKALLTELFIASRSDITPGLQQQVRSLLELNANTKTRDVLRYGLNLRSPSKAKVSEAIQKYTLDSELDAVKLEQWLKKNPGL